MIPNLMKERDHPLQKHFRLYDEKTKIPEPKYYNEYLYNHFEEFEHSLGLHKKVHGIVIRKLVTVKKWANKCAWPTPNYHYIEEYNLFLNKWREFKKQTHKIIFVRYIDLLKKIILQILAKI